MVYMRISSPEVSVALMVPTLLLALLMISPLFQLLCLLNYGLQRCSFLPGTFYGAYVARTLLTTLENVRQRQAVLTPSKLNLAFPAHRVALLARLGFESAEVSEQARRTVEPWSPYDEKVRGVLGSKRVSTAT